MSRLARAALPVGALICAVALVVAAAAPAAPAKRSLLQVGDSLAVGTAMFLPAALRGWSVRESHAISMHADDGPAAMSAYGAALPRVLLVSLGTNDDPAAVSRFARTVRAVLRIAGPRRCVIWSTIVRPPYRGISYDAYNDALRRAARLHPTLRVFDWQGLAGAHPHWFGSDGVHPTVAGYRARAAAIARLVRSC